jgi:hypothetical protein
VVRRSIAKKGFKGAAMFEKAFEQNYDKCVEIAQRYGLTIAKALS